MADLRSSPSIDAAVSHSKAIGGRILARRREMRWSQAKLADLYGVSQDMISRYENGVTDIGAGDLPRMALVLQVPLAYLYGLVDTTGRDPSGAKAFGSFDPAEEEMVAYYRQLPPDLQGVVVAHVRSLRRYIALTNPEGEEDQHYPPGFGGVLATPEEQEEAAYVEAMGLPAYEEMLRTRSANDLAGKT